MKKASFSWELFNKIPVIGIMRNLPVDKIVQIASLFAEEGLTNLEITLNSPGASELISELANRFKDVINIGAGTVCTAVELQIALSAGAAFIVTPVVNEEIIQKCVSMAIPVFPGAYTPTEIYRAHVLGAAMIKVFPASVLGPAYIRELSGPFPHFKLLPTGGISLENMDDFLRAGAKGVGMGGNLFPKEIIEQQRWQDLRKIFAMARARFTDK
ncbi:MAG: bifunctional 4-hydroxy-2-oxoglutarate aldolase/2-dehydro-3-deoxy-phosphogluconate aldolase [Ginsengibacter sp.]